MSSNGTFHIMASDGLELWLLDQEDNLDLFALTDRNRADLRIWLPWVDKTLKPDDTRAFIADALEQYKRCTGLCAGIWYHDRLAGVISYVNMDVNNRKTEIGYWLDAPHRGKGLVTKACASMVDVAFNRLLLNRVEIRCEVNNLKSRAIPESLGFRHEGTLRQNAWINDHYVDMMVYGMLNSEWKDHKGKFIKK